ncbi:MAG: neocarzinostatin apoprotein domain-containing protein [Solirubrobacteraceae bacterium]
MLRYGLVIVVALAVAGLGVDLAPAAAAGPALVVSPAPSALRDGQTVSVAGSGFAPRSAVAVVQCSIRAASDGPDFCNERFVTVAPANVNGSFAARLRVHPVIRTASGTVNCRTTVCLLGAENLGQRSQLAVSALHFAPGKPLTPAPRGHERRPAVPRRGVAGVARPGAPARLSTLAALAGRISGGRIGAVTGSPSRGVPRHAVRGEGLLELTMSAPGTTWASSRDTSVVVQASVDGGQSQTVVLFAGARPFTYEGFTGPLSTGRHRVIVTVSSALSLTRDVVPTAVVRRARLLVVGRHNAAYRALAYAPVLYDRHVVARSDTPQLTYATVSRQPGGAERISYVVTWSNEDAGTGFVPFLLWGGYGRMSDIESAISLTVDRRGAIHDPIYLACTKCGPAFPEDRTALDETDTGFHGQYFAHHPILRVSTGNNDFSDRGRTRFRFQQALAAPPRAGETREGAMDRNPWTYGITDQEVKREREDFSTNSLSPAPGDARQYLIVALDCLVHDVSAVGVDLRLAGSSRIYSNDFTTTYPLYDGGQGRTAVKVPLSLVDRRITMLRLRLQSASPDPTIIVRRISVLEYAHGAIVARYAPRPTTVTQALLSADG